MTNGLQKESGAQHPASAKRFECGVYGALTLFVARGMPQIDRIDLSKPITSPANQYCKNEGAIDLWSAYDVRWLDFMAGFAGLYLDCCVDKQGRHPIALLESYCPEFQAMVAWKYETHPFLPISRSIFRLPRS